MSQSQAKNKLSERLRTRRAEIGQAVLTRVEAVSDPSDTADPEYTEGLRAAIAAAIDYAISALECSEDNPSPIPTALLSQARLAVRNRISLDTVLRRYSVGYTLLGDFIMDEAERAGISKSDSLRRISRVQAALFDRVVAAVGEEYSREEAGRSESAEQRRAERVRRLLAGEPCDTSELGYDLGGWHTGMVLAGTNGQDALRDISESIDCSQLSVRGNGEIIWAWFGGRSRLEPSTLLGALFPRQPGELFIALGEPHLGHSGWRFTHRQARAALPIALRGSNPLVCHSDVALLASMLRDDLLLASLRNLYLVPLKEERDGGWIARKTLRAYFDSARSVSSAAVRLGVSRQTVGSRLRAIEDRLGRSLDSCAIEIEAALRLEGLESANGLNGGTDLPQ